MSSSEISPTKNDIVQLALANHTSLPAVRKVTVPGARMSA